MMVAEIEASLLAGPPVNQSFYVFSNLSGKSGSDRDHGRFGFSKWTWSK
jgi:hypothetical protein